MNNEYNILYNINSNIIEEINPEDILDKIYFLEYRVPTEDDLNKYNKNKTSKDINKLITKNDENNSIIQLIKNYISNLEFKFPLFDVYTSNIYLIHKENIYKRVTYNHYRFPSQKVLEYIKENLNNKIDKNNKNIIEERKIKKYKLIIEFMNNFNLEILKQTYYRMIYKYSDELGKNIIFCKRPSFNKYIHNSKPYYSTVEILNLALNMNIIFDEKKLKTDYENLLYELCSKVKKNDISYLTLLDHQKYISEKNLLGLVQYYTVQGSYYINNYLRFHEKYPLHNKFLDDIILPLWELCINAPAFDNDYILYRFVKDDEYLQHLKIGDIYEDEGFMSTTRDPFYRADSYQFGFILLKIRIAKNIKGAGLCIETISHFPFEQEIIFAPKTKFKLTNRDSDITYYHTDYNFSSKIKTRYEFEFVSTTKPNINKEEFKGETKNINFIDIKSTRSITLTERMNYFFQTYLDEMNRFNTTIGGKTLLVTVEKYNSIGAYENFYGIKTQNGYCMYTLYDNYLLFLIEIGEQNSIPIIHVNYYVKYNTLNKEKIISDDEFITFISSIAYYFNIETIALYPDYKPCISLLQKSSIQKIQDIHVDNKQEEQINLTGNFCVDFYNYLKFKTIRFSNLNINKSDLKPLFTYYDLDYLKEIKLDEYIKKSDDEIYQLYTKSFKLQFPKGNISDFFIWLIDNKCYLIEFFIKILERVFVTSNPFKRDVYLLKPINYLYNKKLINIYGSINSEFEFKERKQYSIETNEYRLDYKRTNTNVSYNLL
jgi:hypothetical protein